MSRASESDAPRTDVERVAVWDLPVRAVHVVAAIIFAALGVGVLLLG